MSEASRPDTLDKKMEEFVELVFFFSLYTPEEMAASLQKVVDRKYNQRTVAQLMGDPFHKFYHLWMDGR